MATYADEGLQQNIVVSLDSGYIGPVLLRFDTQLLHKAGIDTNRKRLVQFYPEKIEAVLLELERRHMLKAEPQYDVDRISRTTFGVKQRGSEYEYYVISQLRN